MANENESPLHFVCWITQHTLQQNLAPCKGIRIPESTNFSLLKSRILGFRIRNPALGIQNPTEKKKKELAEKKKKKNGSPAFLGIRNPLSWNPESSTRNPESTVWNPESKTVIDSLTWGERLAKRARVKVLTGKSRENEAKSFQEMLASH